MRVFAALIPERKDLNKKRAQMREKIKTGKWVEEQNTHLTLAFLGQCSFTQVKDIRRLFLDFPKTPRVLVADKIYRWSGQKGDILAFGFKKTDEERQLYHDRHVFIQSLIQAGLYQEKKVWRAHLTLARKVFTQNTPTVKPFEVIFHHAGLYCSELTEKGPVYTEITENI